MTRSQTVTFFLDDDLRISAEAGTHNFIGLVASVLKAAGLNVEFRVNSGAARRASALHPGYAIFHMDEPTHARALTIRRVYHYPFWQIARTSKRWEWPVAKAVFPASDIDPVEACRFREYWRKRLFADMARPSKDGFVYVPLQGRLTEKRSFQAASPVQMVEATLRSDPVRQVIATFHPREVYSDAERRAIYALAGANPRLSIRTGGMETLLPACDYLVSQNSTVAFNALFFDKPVILFARSDFHHAALNVHDLGTAAAFEGLMDATPDHSAYLWWFWQKMSINAGRDEAKDRIRAALRQAGWPV